MDSIFAKLGEQIPYIVALLVLVYMNQLSEVKREQQRVENAKALEDRREKHEKELEDKRQVHDRDMNNMWASYIKSIIDQQNQAFTALMKTINEHELASQQRYERMGITNDLIEAVKERQKR